MSWSTLSSTIKAKLQTISGLGMVSDDYRVDITSYPAVLFQGSNDPSSFITNTENEHVYTFDLFIVQECESTGTGHSAALTIVYNAIDAVVNAFDSYQTLGGACEYTEAMTSVIDEINTSNGLMVFGRVTLKCHKLKTVT